MFAVMDKEYKSLSIKFSRGEKLGAGAFGEVFLATECDVKQPRTFAVKYIKCTANHELESALKEIKALVAFKHPNIVKMFDFGLHQYKKLEVEFSLVLEYCSGGSLNNRLGRRNSHTRKLNWIKSITSAVVYLHGKGIIHQDLKPDNILLTAAKGVIKVADFGLVRRFARRNEGESWLDYYVTQGVGALAYVAPEMLGERHNYKVDVFSMGILFHAILEGEFTMDGQEKCYGVFVAPGKGKKKPIGAEMHNRQSDLPVPFRGRRRRLITRMLKYDPRQRPTAEEVQDVLTSTWRRWTQLTFYNT